MDIRNNYLEEVWENEEINPWKKYPLISAICSKAKEKREASKEKYTYSAGFEFPNGDSFIIPDPEPDPDAKDGWKEVEHKEYDFFCAYIHNHFTGYYIARTIYVIKETNGSKVSLDVRHKEGKVVAEGYKERSETEQAKCLWYKKWERRIEPKDV